MGSNASSHTQAGSSTHHGRDHHHHGGGSIDYSNKNNNNNNNNGSNGNRNGNSNGLLEEFRVLCAGTSSSGKSTFHKQLRILYTPGFSANERENFKAVCAHNMFLGMKELVTLLRERHIRVPSRIKPSITYLTEECNAFTTQLDAATIQHAKAVWHEPRVNPILVLESSASEYRVGLNYVMLHLDRIARPDYVPTNEDILHVRQRTTGIVETRVAVGKQEWVVTDVGGQASERRKWRAQPTLHALIYFVALDEYDRDESTPGGMTESLRVWEEIVNGDSIPKHVTFILFLNKADLFRQKVKRIPIASIFPDYKHGENFERATKFFRDLYRSKISQQSPHRKDVFWHVTCAIDTASIKVVFEATLAHIIQRRLAMSGL